MGVSIAAATNIGAIDLSGTGTNTITSTAGDTTIGAVTDSANAALTVSSAGNATVAAITLDNAGASALSITADDNDDSAASTLTVGGVINNDGDVTLIRWYRLTMKIIDIDANVMAAGALTVQNAATADLAANINLNRYFSHG